MNSTVFAEPVELPKALVAPADFRPFEWAWLEQSIPTCFAKWVAAQPHGTAVQTADASLTYEQLDRLANHLASRIVQQLGRAAEPVAIMAGSDLHAVVAMLGVLTAGKFFVAINPIATQAEIEAILADSAATMILADAQSLAVADLLPAVAQSGLKLLQIDDPDAAAADFVPGVSVDGAALAQIAYTSGSTGAPKGILKTHRALLHQSMTHINGYFITPADRMMAPAPLIFGASLGIVFSALLGGATLLPIRLRDYTAVQLQEWLSDEQVTVYHSVGSFFRQFAPTLDSAETFPALRIIKLGGETIQPVDIQLFRQNFAAHCVLRIGLASTEAGNYCWHFVGKETVVEGPNVPVGRALVGTEILLLDEHGAPVAPGGIGEIAVRSAYLATGYWRNPDLTHARFLPDPTDAEKTIFLTGDLGKWRDDGLLEHLGRADQMVKVRGNRVELGAVEAALLALPAVKEAVVVAAAGAGDSKRLLAFLTPVGEPLNASQLRLHLRATLPEYMLPARMVWIDKMPLLPSGKIDRSALPSPGRARPDLDTPCVAPRDDLEQQIADIWAELLGLDEVGVDDNFFELGGDSILAMRMALVVEQRVGGHVPPEFFRVATVAYLATLPSSDRPSLNLDQHPVGQRSFGKRAVKSPHPTPRRVLSHLVNGGPIWGDHCLPYGPGRRLQRLWLRLPLIRQQLLTRAAPLQDWLSLLGQNDPDGSKLELSLVANTWRIWRLACIQQQDIFEKYVTVHHVDRLDAVIKSGRPLILVGTHTAGSHSAMRLVIRQRTGKSVWNLGYTGTGPQDAAAKTVYARALLLQGGIVQVTGDGAKGERGVEMSVHGHPWLFRSGGAELALDTDAVMLPVFHTMTLSGHIAVDFQEPLTCASLNRTQQVEELTRRYAALLIDRLPTLVSNMRWYKLRQFQEYSVAAGR